MSVGQKERIRVLNLVVELLQKEAPHSNYVVILEDGNKRASLGSSFEFQRDTLRSLDDAAKMIRKKITSN